MTGNEIQKVTSAIALQLPLANLDYPFGENIQVFKIMDKMFMLSFSLQGIPVINLKVTPDDSEMLRDTYPSIRVGYHMNKRHWISVYAGEEINRELLEDLIQDSYELVVKTLTKAQKQVLAIHSHINQVK